MTQANKDAQPDGPVCKNAVSGFWGWLKSAANFSLVGLLGGCIGTYIQYLNAYEQKVSETAQADMKAATEAFVQTSDAFGKAQMLQQLIYFNYSDIANNKDAPDQAMVTKAAKTAYDDYVKARNELRQNSNIYARKAELYIDWASDLGRDPADTKAHDDDPLTEALLGSYNFDCDADENFARYAPKKDDDPPDSPEYCKRSDAKREVRSGSNTIFCAYNIKSKQINHNLRALTVRWHSAKHHLLVMHYCFELAHGDLETPRIFASGADVGEERKKDFLNDQEKNKNALDQEVTRLDSFLNLVMSQLERIRVKYRPTSFYCSVPAVSSIFSDQCTPVRMAVKPPQSAAATPAPPASSAR